MKTSICNLKKSEYKSLSNDKYSIKKKQKGLKSNIENNIIEKKIKAQKEILNTLNKVNKKKIIKREKSEDLILSKTKVPSPEFGRETTSKISSKKLNNFPLKNSLRKSKKILNKSNESTSSKSYESEDKITPSSYYKHNFINNPKNEIQPSFFQKIPTKIKANDNENNNINNINNISKKIRQSTIKKVINNNNNNKNINKRKSISNENNKNKNNNSNEIKKLKSKKKLDLSQTKNLNKTSDEILKEIDDKEGNYIIEIGEKLNNNRYEIINILGKGAFGISLKCYDNKLKEYVCIKIIKKQDKTNKQAKIEIKLLEYIKKHDPKQFGNFVQLKNFFIHKEHYCLVFELLANNLYEEIQLSNYEGFDLKIIKKFTIQILFSLLCLKHFHIIHCDLKPENILLITKGLTGLKIIDFGSSCFTSEKIYCYIQSRFYRAPEVILGLEYDIEIDMWSLGCLLYELYTGKPIFPGENEYDQLYYIIEFLGLPPKFMIDNSPKKNLFFDQFGNCLEKKTSFGKIRKPNTKSIRKRLKFADKDFVRFVEECLKWDRKNRLTPFNALKHKWIIKDFQKDMLEIHNKKIEDILNNDE